MIMPGAAATVRKRESVLMLWCLCCLCMEFYRKANSFLLKSFFFPSRRYDKLRHFLYVLRNLKLQKDQCVPSERKFSVCVYALSGSTFALPHDTFHQRRSPDIWGLPSHSLERRKNEKKNQCGFQVILLLVGLWQLECSQGWAGLHLAPLSVRVCPRLSEHVRSLLRCSAALCHHKIRITKGALRGTRGGFWRNGATRKSSEAFLKWLTATQQEHVAVQRRLRVSSHVPCSYCARFMTTERSCLINILPFSSSWDVLHCFFPSPRQVLSLPLCDRLANLRKLSHTESEPGFTGITSCLRHRGFS